MMDGWGEVIVDDILLLTLCNRLMIESLYSELPSIMPVMGFENHSLNSRCDWNTCGIRKCISDHNSIKLFCNGVPVSSKRLQKGERNARNTKLDWMCECMAALRRNDGNTQYSLFRLKVQQQLPTL